MWPSRRKSDAPMLSWKALHSAMCNGILIMEENSGKFLMC